MAIENLIKSHLIKFFLKWLKFQQNPNKIKRKFKSRLTFSLSEILVYKLFK